MRHLVKACRLDHAFAVNQAAAEKSRPDGDPLAVADAEAPDHVVPAAVLRVEIVGQFGEIEQLVRVLVRIVEPAEHDVGPAADVGRHRCFRTDVLEVLGIHPHFHSGDLVELFGIGEPLFFVALDETFPAQHPQFRAFFRLVTQIGSVCAIRPDQCACGARDGRRAHGPERFATREFAHFPLLVKAAPVRTATAVEPGRNAQVDDPGLHWNNADRVGCADSGRDDTRPSAAIQDWSATTRADSEFPAR